MKDQKQLLIKCLLNDIPAIVFQGTDKCTLEILQAASEIYKRNGCSKEFLYDFQQLINNFTGYQKENPNALKVPELTESEKEVIRIDMQSTTPENTKKAILKADVSFRYADTVSSLEQASIKLKNALSQEKDLSFIQTVRRCAFDNRNLCKGEERVRLNKLLTIYDTRISELKKTPIITNKQHMNINGSGQNQILHSSESKIIIGDVSYISEENSKITNLRIKDKSTGMIAPLQTNGINIFEKSPEDINKLLSGRGIEAVNKTGILKLSRIPSGWSLNIAYISQLQGKQMFNTTDASVDL